MPHIVSGHRRRFPNADKPQLIRPAGTSTHAGDHTPSPICIHGGAEVVRVLGVNQIYGIVVCSL